MYSVFISYATKDGIVLAKSVARMLQKDYCLDVFVADEEIRVGEFIESRIKNAMSQSQRILVLFTPKAVKSEWVLGEVDLAMEMGKDIIICRAHDVNNRLLPIRLQRRKHIIFESKIDLLDKLRQIEWGITVVIPAGGIAGGLHPISVGMPKTLFPVGTKPILHHIIDRIGKNTKVFSKAIVLTSRFSKMIEYYVDILESDIPVECRCIPDKLPVALKKLQLKSAFMVHYSDIILEGKVDWKGFIEYHRFKRTTANVISTLMVSRQYNLPVGRIVVNNQDIIEGFTEKPHQTLESYINVAVSIFEPEFLTYVKASDDRLYGDCISNAVKAGKKFAIFKHEAWKHIQTLTDWYEAQKKYFPEDML